MHMRIAAFFALFAIAATPATAHGPDPGHGKAAPKPSEAPSPLHADGHAATLGMPGDSKSVSRTIAVAMSDAMRFAPDRIDVKKGETIRFVVTNSGATKHEMVLGTAEELREHAALMAKFPGMEHDDPNAVSVEPGKTGTLIWKFENAGTFSFACLLPGHFEAGMKGMLAVGR